LLKIGVVVVVLIIALTLFYNFEKTSVRQTTGIFPNLQPQWMDAMNWVKSNTAEDAVFAHWWDYGYWIQTGGERATFLDGGNAIPYWNYLMGRHVLTTTDDQIALEYLYTHNATHLLIDPSDIGKYPAYSTIGSDVDYDRYSWIHQFNLNDGATQETRDGFTYIFQGGTLLDADFEWEGRRLVAERTGIGGFLVPTLERDNNIIFERPTAIIVDNGQRIDIPLNCVIFNGEITEFEGDGLDGCINIIPTVNQQGQVLRLGTIMYLSPKVKDSLMARLYIINQDHPNFKLVYPKDTPLILDVEGIGRISPIKIWEIVYPKDIESNPAFLEKDWPNQGIARARGFQ